MAVLIGLNRTTQTEGIAKSLDFYRGIASLHELDPPNRVMLSVPSEKCTGGAQGMQAAHCREMTLRGVSRLHPHVCPRQVWSVFNESLFLNLFMQAYTLLKLHRLNN